MRILLEYCFDHCSSRKLYGHVAASLRRRGMEATAVQFADGMDVSSYDVLISHDYVDRRGIDESATRVYGGREMTRPEEMAVIAASGVPVMPWALAANEAEVLDLFGRWRAQRLLLKRSGTFKGDGVTVFDRRHAGAVGLSEPGCRSFGLPSARATSVLLPGFSSRTSLRLRGIRKSESPRCRNLFLPGESGDR